MAYQYDRSESLNRSVADQITSVRLQDFNQELDQLFVRLDDRNLALTYDIQNRLTQIVDNNNAITINITRVNTNTNLAIIYIQEVGDPNRYTIQYIGSLPSTVLYGP